ncbi:MAG: pyridoxamine 5'-phosphate oxidase family protein, partial [Pseudonocardia sp.]|nr:pyridoxamine 5'-phosphate oxidase family protein [Pseudonocardia sp.]
MPRTLTATEREQFLAQPHIGVISVANDTETDGDRPPLTVPVWYAYEPGGDLTFFTGTQGRTARKARLLERAGKLSFCVQRPTYPYKYVTVECVVARADRSPTRDQVYAVTSRYL